jgi:predicted GIY-YIG superfamily endonuclease
MKITVDTFIGSLDLQFNCLYQGAAVGLAKYRIENKFTLQNESGIYIYIADNGECVYIGKAKNLNNRIQEHNREMCVEPLTDRKRAQDKQFVECFEPHKDRLIRLMFCPIAEESDRAYIEIKLQEKYSSQFKHRAAQHNADKKVYIF